MAFADEQSYEEMINALQNFKSRTEEQCNVMESAAKDCVDNTDNDPAAQKSSSKLSSCVSNIRATFETIDNIIAALQDELEDIRAAAAKADQIGD
ncbi:MAG: hypothetical protein IJA87_02400 [Clostridia bacterium]|nr:hypothetical protein [Clostridia bacterium]